MLLPTAWTVINSSGRPCPWLRDPTVEEEPGLDSPTVSRNPFSRKAITSMQVRYSLFLNSRVRYLFLMLTSNLLHSGSTPRNARGATAPPTRHRLDWFVENCPFKTMTHSDTQTVQSLPFIPQRSTPEHTIAHQLCSQNHKQHWAEYCGDQIYRLLSSLTNSTSLNA